MGKATLPKEEITLEAFGRMSPAYILDVRERHEWDKGHLAQAQLWSVKRLRNNEWPELPSDTTIVVYCQGGVRSLEAVRLLRSRGHQQAVSLQGGYAAWRQRHKPGPGQRLKQWLAHVAGKVRGRD